MLDLILVPLDGSDFSERAVPFAAEIARAAGARIRLMRAVVELRANYDVSPELEERLLSVAEQELVHFTDELRDKDIAAEWSLQHEDAARAILKCARDEHVDLIIMSTHGRGGFGRLLYGSVAEQVLRGSTVPVLMVPPTAVLDWESKGPLRVIAALDGSQLAEETVPFLSTLVRQLGAEVVLVRALEPPNYWSAANPFALESESSARTIAAETYLQAIASRLGRVHVSTHVEPGLASDVITEAVRRLGADAVVMATHGRTGVPRVILGNVADSVLARASVPVCLIRPALIGDPVFTTALPDAGRLRIQPAMP